jgi:hypothetical protein
MSNTNNQSGSKRPYATLDLKATEIKVSKIGDTAASAIGAAKSDYVPLPLPPSAYATETAPAVAGVPPGASAAKPAASSPSAAQAPATARLPRPRAPRRPLQKP